jgi:DNA primase
VIPTSFVQDLLSRADIVEIVGRWVDLKRAGVNHKGLCPFHGEKTPSFIVSASRQTYHCFGCGVHGNAIGFLMEHGGLSFPDAVRDLAGQLGVAVPEDERSPQEREQEREQKEKRQTLSDVLEKAAANYRTQLKASPRAVEYLKGRGLTGEIAARFGLGYAPEGWRGLASVFPRYDDPLLEESGLVIVKDEEGDGNGNGNHEADRKRYDRFRDRIMFPIRNVQGDVIGFGGRVLDQGEPKYLNSPETPVFSKGRELYGLFEARAALRQRGCVLVVEGYMDVVALAQSGFGNAVATLGTACTAEHVQKLFRFTDSVVFSFDGDEAGRRAAGRALEAALPHATDTRTVRFLFLPPEHDPDSYVREHGAEAFEAFVAAAVPLSKQIVAVASAGCDLATAEGRARMLAHARPLVAQLPDGLLRGQIVDGVAAAGGVAPERLRGDWLRGGAPRRGAARGGHDDRGAARDDDGGDDRGDERGDGFTRNRFTPRRSGGRPNLQAVGKLDRAVWLLARRSDLWETLTPDAHALLVDQPSPYGEFFSGLDRLIHDEGAVSAPIVFERLGQEAPPVRTMIDRVAQLLEMPVDDGAAEALAALVAWLELDAVQAELKLLAESGDLSDAARDRQIALYRRQQTLKAPLPRPAA